MSSDGSYFLHIFSFPDSKKFCPIYRNNLLYRGIFSTARY